MPNRAHQQAPGDDVVNAATDVVGTRVDQLGECPLWDPRLDALYTIDIDGRSVHRTHPTTAATEVQEVSGRPGSIALTADPNTLLAAIEDQLGWLDWNSGALTPWRRLDTGGPANRLNDGACDRSGRFWVGSMHENASESTGILHRVAGSGESTEILRATGVPNGLAFSPDGATMYYADSLAKTVWAYDYDTATGNRSNQRVLTDFAGLPGTADGATIDEDGCYWIACVFGSAIARITPQGDVDRLVAVPVDKPTKPAFGGTNLDTLFVTSIGGGGSHERHDDPGLNGRLLAIDVGVRGVQEPIFSGVPGQSK